MPPDDARASAKDRSSAPAETSVDETSRYFTDGEREWDDSERIRACATHLLERCATCGEDQSVSNDYWRRVQRERYVRAVATRVATKDAAKPRRVVVEVECPLFALARGGNAVFNVSVVAPLENLYAKVRERIAKVVEKLRHEGFPFQASGLGEEINDYVNQFYLSRMDSERYTENGVHVFTHILYRDETLLDCMPTVIANQPTLSKLITEKSMELPPYPLLTAVLKSCVQHMFIIADAYESTVQQLGEPNHSLSDEIFWMNPGDTFQRHFVDMCNFFNRPVDDVRFVACDSDRKFFVVEPTDTPEKLHLRDQTELVMVNRALMSTIEFLQHRGSKLFTRPAGGV